jgi:hypothetical protein
MTSPALRKPWTFWRGLRWATGMFLAWVLFLLGAVLIAYGRAYWNDGGGREAAFAIDMRADPANPGKVVELVTRRAEPDEGLIIGHTWVVWPENPPHASMPGQAPGWGHYADPFWQGFRAVVLNVLNPAALVTGMPRVPGRLMAETWAQPQMRIVLTLDATGYARVEAVHRRWAAETRYSVRPGTFGPRIACQDYVYDIAEAAGLKTPKRDWMEFPYTSFLRLLDANAIDYRAGQS